MREPTLPLIADVLQRNIGFRSPLPVRARLLWRGLLCRAQAFRLAYSLDGRTGGFAAYGWRDCESEMYYVTRVEKL